MSARFCAKCGAPFRARGEVVCGLCGAPRVRRDVDEEVEPTLPPELEAQLAAARSVSSPPKRSPILIGCLGLTVVGILMAIVTAFCAGGIEVNPNPTTPAIPTSLPFPPR